MVEAERLVVELDAKIDGYIRDLKKAQKQNDDTGKSGKKLSESIKSVAKAGVVAATAMVALGSAMSAVIVSTARARQEQEAFARQAKTSVEDFNSLSFATKQYGINAEQIADISKDVSDRLGEFATAGTGTFQDFADVMGLSKNQAQDLAEEWKTLGSDEVIGNMVSMMEDAGASGNQLTFVLESMGNDLSKLTPLFTNNSEKLRDMRARYDEVNSSLGLTRTQAEGLRGAAESFDLMTESMGKSTSLISATLAPVFEGFFNGITDVVPEATQAIVDFINSFLDAENITSIAAVNKEIASSTEEIAKHTAKLEGAVPRVAKGLEHQIDLEKQRLAELEKQLGVLEAQEKSIADAEARRGGSFGSSGTGGTGDLDGAETSAQLTAIDERLKAFEDEGKTKLELLEEQYAKERELLQKNVDNEIEQKEKLKLLDEEFRSKKQEAALSDDDIAKEKMEKELENLEAFHTAKLISDKEYAKRKKEIEESFRSGEEKLRDKALKGGISALETFGKKNEKAAKAAFYVKQAQKGSEAVVNTAAGITEALPNYYLAAAVGITGAAQIAAIASTSFGGGGGGSSPSVGGGGTITNTQQDFQPETTELDVSEQSDAGTQTLRVVIGTDDGTDLIDTIGKQLKTAEDEGRV